MLEFEGWYCKDLAEVMQSSTKVMQNASEVLQIAIAEGVRKKQLIFWDPSATPG